MSNLKKYRGIIPAMVTPFNKDGEIDISGVKNLVNHLVAGKVNALFTLSSTGELAVLTDKDKEKLIKVIVDEADDRLPVYSGVSSPSLKDVIRNIEKVAKVGVKGVVIVAPYFFNYTQEELIQYFKTIANNSPIPIIIYNIPDRVPENIEISTLEVLSEEKMIVGLKDTTENMIRFMNLLYKFKDRPDFSLFQGSEFILAPSFIFGGDGATVAAANIAPKFFVDLYELCLKNDIKGAYRLQQKISAFSCELFTVKGDYSASINSFLFGMKTALNLIGICDFYHTQMNQEPNKEDIEKVKDILIKYDLLPIN